MQTIFDNVMASIPKPEHLPVPINSHLENDNYYVHPDGFVESGGFYHSHDYYSLNIQGQPRIYFADGDLVNKDYNSPKVQAKDGNYYYPDLLDKYGNAIHDNYACYLCVYEDGQWNHYRFQDRYYFEQVNYLMEYSDHRYNAVYVENTLRQVYDLSWMYIYEPLDIQCRYGLYTINQIVKNLYSKDVDVLVPILSVIFYGMLAENNKQGTKLGSSIKMNGLYKLVHEKTDVIKACDCYRGGSYQAIMHECLSYGIWHPYFDNPPDAKSYQSRYLNRMQG